VGQEGIVVPKAFPMAHFGTFVSSDSRNARGIEELVVLISGRMVNKSGLITQEDLRCGANESVELGDRG
jgi:hypothetical protein